MQNVNIRFDAVYTSSGINMGLLISYICILNFGIMNAVYLQAVACYYIYKFIIILISHHTKKTHFYTKIIYIILYIKVRKSYNIRFSRFSAKYS